jgi:MFS transporter, FHS family, glucose/mannose:H+ symporter
MKVDASVTQPFSRSALRFEPARLASEATPHPISDSADYPPPSLPLMHAIFLLAGLGTMLLGPILPLLSHKWNLTDSHAGLLLLAQFSGATIGGATASSKLIRGLMEGIVAAAIGFSLFAAAPGLAWALPALAIGGFGVGRATTMVNIIGGARFTANRGSALARLNFTWSFGALLSPLLAAWLVHIPLQARLAAFAAIFTIVAAILTLQIVNAKPAESASSVAASLETPLPGRFFGYFAALLFIYGGLETSLAGWLTTYDLRYGKTSLVLSEYTMVLLLVGLTSGRAISSWLLLKFRETTLQRAGLALAAALAAALALAHQSRLIAVLAVLLGMSLAPVFPATFALLMAHRPPARKAGLVLAASGIGASALPWLMGVVSTRTNSLQIALALPVAAAVVMLLVVLFPPHSEASADA